MVEFQKPPIFVATGEASEEPPKTPERDTYAFDADDEPLFLTGRWHCAAAHTDCPHFADCSIFGCKHTPKRNEDDPHSMREGQPIPYLARAADL